MTSLPPVDRAHLVATRRDLHQHPELGFEERRTGTLVAERLGQLGYTVRTGVGRTGVVAVRDGGPAGGRCVLIRADMDALPVDEANDVPYRSKHPGKMHACGLDAPNVDAAFGIHLWNDLPAGTIALMAGPIMASVDEFEITITGKGGHA